MVDDNVADLPTPASPANTLAVMSRSAIVRSVRRCFQRIEKRLFDSARSMRGLAAVLAVCSSVTGALADDEATTFFERHVRPVLVERCQRCHGQKKQSGGLRVDSRDALTRGGDRGPAIIPGDSQQSLLARAIRHLDDLQMPPKKELTERDMASIERWIELGAPWPDAVGNPKASPGDSDKNHWAFQRVSSPPPPGLENDNWIRTPVDAFVKTRLKEQGLTPSPPADRRTLIRRVHYTLTGLPPSPADVQRFVSDPDPNAYATMVDRLLGSPAYGEHWARHWLDIARYSDTKGYVYAREERHWVHAWPYRDWVARALNENMPYDRFLLLQLAADQVDDRRQTDLAAMGFLTLGRRFLGVNRDIIDDRIDVVCRGMLGLTVSCARCHDHKYDPIPTADYYSLYGVFDSCAERLLSLNDEAGSEEFRSGLQKRQQDLSEKLSAYRDESSARCRDRVVEYLRAQRELHKYPANGFDQVFQKSDLLPAFVRSWESYLYESGRRNDPIFSAWHAYADIPLTEFARRSASVTEQLHQSPSQLTNAIVARQFETPPESFDEVIDRYGEIFTTVDGRWKELVSQRSHDQLDPPSQLSDPDAEQLRQVLYGPGSPCVVPEGPIVHSETYFDSASCTELWKSQGEVDRWIINSEGSEAFALVLTDRAKATTPRVFRRGDPLNKGESVPRRFLSLLVDENDGTFQHGSGRLELAQAIIDPENPLTARVIVNRVWTQHFGQGLVGTASDFGTRAGEPSHPALLDFLASRFIDEGWDLKKLHRSILLSATYRQASMRPDGEELVHAMQIDPDNRLLWRMNPRRLSFEEFRDSLLSSSDQLDRRMGGKPTGLFDKPFPHRRTVYGEVDRQYLPAALRVFDFANPDLHVPKRAETTVPQQALFLMNHPLLLERAVALAELARRNRTPEQSVDQMFQQTLQRSPTREELADALQLVHSSGTTPLTAGPETERDWQYGFGMLDETEQRVTGFTALPHFTGSAWQGGPKWPDSVLGWVQLTATGGHPGNDRQHAAIRRWTAPRGMTIQIRSQLIHERAPGDGVRGFIVSSRQGVLSATTVHQDTAQLNVDSFDVSAGETIDFVVDIGDVLNSDEHLWTSVIETTELSGDVSSHWNSESDFSRSVTRQLDPWEQLAQVLLCTNEFTFID